jgi:hypothetical protein
MLVCGCVGVSFVMLLKSDSARKMAEHVGLKSSLVESLRLELPLFRKVWFL